MTRRFSICQTCHKVVDLDWDAHDGGSDDQGRECWYCPACCPAEQCVPEPCPRCGRVYPSFHWCGWDDDDRPTDKRMMQSIWPSTPGTATHALDADDRFEGDE